jgi:hypothetical protein
LLLVTVATLIGTPVGILAGTYLAEYGKKSRLASATRFLNDVLLSAPSIVIGLFVYSVYVARVKHFSGWAGALALALIVVPVVVRTTDDMLKLVPNSLREAAVALERHVRLGMELVAVEDDELRVDPAPTQRLDVRPRHAGRVHRAVDDAKSPFSQGGCRLRRAARGGGPSPRSASRAS